MTVKNFFGIASIMAFMAMFTFIGNIDNGENFLLNGVLCVISLTVFAICTKPFRN